MMIIPAEADSETLVNRYGREVIYLIRPDGHISASFKTADAEKINALYQRMPEEKLNVTDFSKTTSPHAEMSFMKRDVCS